MIDLKQYILKRFFDSFPLMRNRVLTYKILLEAKHAPVSCSDLTRTNHVKLWAKDADHLAFILGILANEGYLKSEWDRENGDWRTACEHTPTDLGNALLERLQVCADCNEWDNEKL